MSGTRPDISLNVAGGGGPNAPPLPVAGPNLGSLGQLMQVQQSMNAVRLFQQEFAAKQSAGQIIAASPDLETGIKNILGNPQTAAFAPGLVNELRNMQMTMTNIQGAQATQARDAFGAVMKAATGALADPTRLPGLIQSQMALIPPEIRQRVLPAVQTYTQSLLSDLPSDPAAAKTEYQKRLIGTLVGSGVSGEAINNSIGTPTTQQIGDKLVSGVQAPAYAGGGFRPATALPMGSPAGYRDVGGVPVAAPGVPGGTAAPGTTNDLGGATPPSSAAAAPATSPLVGNGQPLYNPQIHGISPAAARGAGLGGINVLSPVQQNQANKISDDFEGPERRQYEMANTGMASLKYMDSSYDNMVKNGGFLVPGTAADFRTDLARTVNTLAQITGQTPPFDPTKIASVEDFNKETKRMGLMVTNQFLGGQREAAQIIQGITSSVPGVSNSYMGGKLVSAGIQAALQRVIDQRHFQNDWQANPANQGSLVGSNEAFNKAYPAEDYARQVLGKFGLGEKGFQTPEAVGQAVKQGYLTPQQGASLLHQQFPDRFHEPGQGATP